MVQSIIQQKTLLSQNLTTYVKFRLPTPCIFQPDLNAYEDIGFSENLIQFKPSNSKSIKVQIFIRTNKKVWLEKRTAIGNLEIFSAALLIEIKNIQVDDEVSN